MRRCYQSSVFSPKSEFLNASLIKKIYIFTFHLLIKPYMHEYTLVFFIGHGSGVIYCMIAYYTISYR